MRRRPKVETRKFAGISASDADAIPRALAERSRQFELHKTSSVFTVEVGMGDATRSDSTEPERTHEKEEEEEEDADGSSEHDEAAVQSNDEEDVVQDDLDSAQMEFASIDTAQFNFDFELPEEDKCVSCSS